MKDLSIRILITAGLLVSFLLPVAAFAQMYPATVNWNGLYLGAHGAYGWSAFSNTPGVAGPNGSGSSWLGGAQIGNNWQINRVVFGVEGDASKMDFISRNPSATFDEDWMSSVRARAGYSLDQFLPYVTAGVGMTDIVSKAPGVGSNSNVQPGLALGGGVDFTLGKMGDRMNSMTNGDHWFGRIEYLNVDVPKNSDHFNGTAVRGGSNNDIVRVGLNYKF